MLCIGSPLTAWLTSRIERRTLLTATLAILALANVASAFAPDYASLLVIRLVMLAVGALYTPQAAGTVALIVPEEKRGSTIAYIFLGWSLAAAVGLPLITLDRQPLRLARGVWRHRRDRLHQFPAAGVASAARTDRRAGRSQDLGRCRRATGLIVLLLSITTLQMSGQFVVFTFMGPLLTKLTEAGPDAIGLVFALYGVFGFVGIAIATRIVDSWGAYKTSLLFTARVADRHRRMGAQRRHLPVDGRSVAIWGLGFASTNSMQQVRLVAAAPALASASVSLNTSVLYVGQAVGSAIGGMLYARDLLARRRLRRRWALSCWRCSSSS